MAEPMPWTTRRAMAALGLVFGVALLGFLLLLGGQSLGWLCLALATWFTVGLVTTAMGSAAGDDT